MPMRRALLCSAALLGGASALAPAVAADANAVAPKGDAASKVSFTAPKEATSLMAAKEIPTKNKLIEQRDRRTAYEWAEFLGFAPYIDCSKVSDVAGTVPFFEATLGTGAPGGTLERIPAQTAHLYLLLATCAEGAVPIVKNGWQFVRSWVNQTVRADVYFKKTSCVVAFASTAPEGEGLVYRDVSAAYVGNGFFMPKSVKQHYDYVRSGVLLDCDKKRTIAIGHGSGGAIAQIARAYADAEESWTYNSIKTIINGHGPSQSVLPHSVHAYTRLEEIGYACSDHVSQLPMNQPYITFTQGANNFELLENRHVLASLDEVSHKDTRMEGSDPVSLEVETYPRLQNYTNIDDSVVTEMMLVESVKRVHLPYMGLEILEALY